MSNKIWEIGPDGAPKLRQKGSFPINNSSIVNETFERHNHVLKSVTKENESLIGIYKVNTQKSPKLLSEMPVSVEDEIADSEEEPELVVVLALEMEILRSQRSKTNQNDHQKKGQKKGQKNDKKNDKKNNKKNEKTNDQNNDHARHKTDQYTPRIDRADQLKKTIQETKIITDTTNSPSTKKNQHSQKSQHANTVQQKLLRVEASPIDLVARVIEPSVDPKSIPQMKTTRSSSLSTLCQKSSSARYRVGLSKRSRVDSLHRIVLKPAAVSAPVVKSKRKLPSTS